MKLVYFLTFLVFSILFSPILFYAQSDELVTVTGSSQVEYPDHLSLNEVKKTAQEQAIVNALEKAFGTIIIEGNSTFAQNIVTGTKIETNSVFNSIGNHWVKGEVIEILNSDFKETTRNVVLDDNNTEIIKHIECSIRIKAREIPDNVIEFDLLTLKCLNINCRSNSFKAEVDDFYLYIKSPVSGYLAVYLDDGNISQRLFPYSNMGEKFDSGVPIKANTEYFLFSDTKEHDYFYTPIDEYVFITDQIMEQNRLFAIFSTTPILQPYAENEHEIALSKSELNEGWDLPLSVSSEEFQRWLINSRIKNRSIRVQIKDIIIKKD